ncbi:hypothetical protein JCM30471_29230 [Desulfuromonas carbonis]
MRWLVLGMLFLLTACARVPLALPETDAQMKRLTPPPGKALLYVYRGFSPAGAAVVAEPEVDGQRLGGLAPRNFLVAQLEPGKHLYKRGSSGIPLYAKAGETYFIEATVSGGDAQVAEAAARKKLAGCTLIYESDEPIVIGQTRAQPAAPPSATGAPPPVITSDVDELPVVRRPERANAYAVVIGIENYRQNLPAAPFARHDAETVTAYLIETLGYPEEHVVTLTNDRAAKSDFEKYFEKWLPNQVEPGATLFVYYSGHGAPNSKSGDAYLVPYDGDPAFLEETGYSLKRLYAALGRLPAKEITVALDACFSGAGGRSVIAQGTRSIALNLKAQTPLAGNLTVLAASSGEQTSSTYAEKGHGLFTYFLLKGIKNEEVVMADGTLRLDDLFAYLQPQVERVARREYNNEQTPQLIGVGRLTPTGTGISP